jgi:nicotinamide-nucleotide adenylyltransferase
MNSIFIGRFQPPHMGHLSVLQRAIHESDHLYIAIGSPLENFQSQNPFTVAERIQMLHYALKEISAPSEKYSIIPIPNINNYAIWPAHIESYIPDFQRIYTGSEVVATLFSEHNRKLREPYEIVFIKKDLQISSTEVRERIIRKRNWQKFVPLSVAKFLQDIHAEDRLPAIQEQKK